MNGEKTSPTEYKYGNIIVRKASISDFPALSKMLARAFDDNPWVNWMCLQDRHRTGRITRAMHIALHLARPFGEVYTTQDLTGAAAWIDGIGFKEMLMLLPKVIRVTGVKHIISRLIVLNILEECHPRAHHWCLLELGTEPSLQGKGIGCALLQPFLNRCDRDHIPTYLETQTQKNVRFYEHSGFKVIKYLEKLPFGAPDTWIMWREPR